MLNRPAQIERHLPSSHPRAAIHRAPVLLVSACWETRSSTCSAGICFARRPDDGTHGNGAVLPWAWSVAAVVRMTKYMIRFENSIPVTTSFRDFRNSASVAPLRDSTVNFQCSLSSSTSCDACQKNRYGEIVVPKIPTKRGQYLPDHSMWGINVEWITAVQSGLARNAARTYANSTSVSHLKIRATA